MPTYPKSEKLKGKTLIDELFRQGKSVSKYPLRMVFLKTNFDDGEKFKTGVSVSKKYFKKAVDRNYFKRVLRETYRLNKHLLENSEGSFAMMILYQSKDRLSYEEINQKTVQLFEKFLNELNSKIQP